MWLASHSSTPVLCLHYDTQVSIIWQIYKRFFSPMVIIVTSYIALPFGCGWDFCLFCVNMANPYDPISLCSNKKNPKWAEMKCTPQSCIYPNSYLSHRLSVVPLTSNGITSLGKREGTGLSLHSVPAAMGTHSSWADIPTQARTPKAAWMLQELSFKADAS